MPLGVPCITAMFSLLLLITTSPETRIKLSLVQNFRPFSLIYMYSLRVSRAIISSKHKEGAWTRRGCHIPISSRLNPRPLPTFHFKYKGKTVYKLALKVIYKLECNQSTTANSIKNHQSRTYLVHNNCFYTYQRKL